MSGSGELWWMALLILGSMAQDREKCIMTEDERKIKQSNHLRLLGSAPEISSADL